MALARTNLLGQISAGNFGTGNFTSNSFTPANNSLLVVGQVYVENSGSTTDPTSALTISGGGLTFTQQATAVAAPTAFPSLVKIWTAPVTTGASMTLVSSTSGRNAGLYGVSVVCYTGYNTGTPVGGTATGQQNGGFGAAPNAVSLTFSGAPASGDEAFGFVFANKTTTDITPGSTLTEIDDQFNSNWGDLESETRTGSTSTTVDWVDLRPGGGSLFNYAAAAIVIQVGGASITPNGVPIAVGLGQPTVSQSLTVTPAGIAVPAAIGQPTLTWSGSITPNGTAVPVALGQPSVSMIIGTVSPTGIAVPVAVGQPRLTFTASSQGGSWWQLDAIARQNRQNADQERKAGPLACPNDGEPLLYDPRLKRRRCPYDGWISPV